jgi:hypothetical protein
VFEKLLGVGEWPAMSNAQLLEQSPRQGPSTSYWIITKHDHSQLRALTISLSSGKEALAAFSFKEEAELFLILGQASESWQVRESSTGEIISLLMGPYVDVGRIALDPAPEILAEKTGGFVSINRKRFMDLILDRGR